MSAVMYGVNLTLSVFPDRPTTVPSFGSTTVDILTSPLPVVSMMSITLGFPSVVVCGQGHIQGQGNHKIHFIVHNIIIPHHTQYTQCVIIHRVLGMETVLRYQNDCSFLK